MNELPARILDAHGGTDRWNGYAKVEATIVSGGVSFLCVPKTQLRTTVAGCRPCARRRGHVRARPLQP